MSAPLSRLVFLVVDDNAHMLKIVRTILRGLGAVEVVTAPDAATAFGIIREREIDLLFVDYNLGAVDGVAFTRLLRTAADSPNPYMPIVMISAHAELFRVEAAREAGANDFLVKPLSAMEVYRKILDAIERPRPFVRAFDFFGPDRRRRRDPAFVGPERRATEIDEDPESVTPEPQAETV